MPAYFAEKKTAVVKGRRMSYVEHGTGAPIVFQHGNPTSAYLWRNVMPHLEGLGRLIACDLIGMGDSDKLDPSGPDRYSYREHRDYLFALWEQLGIERDVVLVLHDWGSALGFDWANQHRDRVAGIAYMESFVTPLTWDDYDPRRRDVFEHLRSAAGEGLVLEQNFFVEVHMPNGILRALSAEEMAEYVKPFATPGEDRRPTLSWARQVPINGHPADVDAIVSSYGRWLARSDVPKLFINADPGALLTRRPRELCRTWPNQTEVTVAGKHFVQEDSPDQIGQAIRHFVHGIRLRDGREETLMPGPPTPASAEPRKPAANATPPAPARAPRFSLEAGVPDRSAFPRAAWQTELRRASASAPDRLASPDREPVVGQANPPSLAPIEGETAMPATEPEPADCLRTEEMPWIATSPGKSFRPLRFDVDGWSELMRLEPGSLVARHRHTGDVHAFNLSGSRRILESGEIVGPGDYVYEPAGLIDAWEAVGDRPCVVHIKIVGAVEYLDDKDQVIDTADAESQCRTYLAWCEEHHCEPVTQIIGLTSRDEAALPAVAGRSAGA